MKLEDDSDAIVDVQICAPDDDVLLTTALGSAYRFPVEQVRVSQRAGRRRGVRGIKLGAWRCADRDQRAWQDRGATPAEARADMKRANAARRAGGRSRQHPGSRKPRKKCVA